MKCTFASSFNLFDVWCIVHIKYISGLNSNDFNAFLYLILQAVFEFRVLIIVIKKVYL